MKKCMVLESAGCAAALLLAGCFDVEQSLSLQRDLSGKAGFSMAVDLEPMVVIMASMQRSMAGKTGEPTPAEIEQGRKEFLEQQKKDDPAKKQQEVAEQKAQFERSLPPGVKLLSSSVDDQGLKLVARFEFGFDDVRKLARIKMPEKSGEGPGKNPYQEPFAGLKVVDEGSTLLVTLGGVDPASPMKNHGDPSGQGGQGAQGAQSPEMQKALLTAFQKARFAFRLDSPLEVVATNATRRDGHTLYWEIRASDPGANLPQTLMARLKK
jgi:hypothetical protein